MDTAALSALTGVVAFAVAAAVGYFALRIGSASIVRRAEREAERLLADAEASLRSRDLEAQEDALRYRREAEDELRDQRGEAGRTERRLEQREEALERRAEALEGSEQSVRDRQLRLDERERELEGDVNRTQEELQRIAVMSMDEARATLLDQLDVELRDEQARRVRAMEASAKADADSHARKTLATVMQRMTSEVTAETTVSVVPIPSDDLKGRIIGREGRNIRAFEAATGCDLIIDDTPEIVTVSGFDPVRREVARVALGRLIQDGRIQPTRIEEAVDRARAEVEQSVVRSG